jgi:Mg2+-importing ATPase
MAEPFWAVPIESLLREVGAATSGLDRAEAAGRLVRFGRNTLEVHGHGATFEAVRSQVRNPLAWLLLFAAAVSGIVREWTDASVIVAILLLGATLGVLQERRAGRAIALLRSRIAARARVLRDGQEQVVPAEDVVPGDVLVLAAGTLVAADARVLDAKDFFVSQAVLTGETLPVEKTPGVTARDATLAERTNVVFQGTSVRSGTAHALVVRTGRGSEYGAVAARLVLRPPETDFDRGIRRFGYLLTRVMGALVLLVFAASALQSKPPVASLLFAIALAVGLAPEMLPAILSITLSHGARAMAARGVVVRRLNAIENFGSMDVLCTDKTGTLTEGVVQLARAVDPAGRDAPEVLRRAFQNAALQTGLANLLDGALVAAGHAAGLSALPEKLDEVPYDFTRKRLSVVVREADGTATMVTKGALERVLEVCASVRAGEGETVALDATARQRLHARFDAWSAEGIRVLGVATRAVSEPRGYEPLDERALVFEGFLLFLDPAKPGVDAVVRDLSRLGVALKIVTGDQRDVARHLAVTLKIPVLGVLTGREIAALADEALWHVAERTTIFAEVDPNQKERIILALRKTGHVVGYMGDGINDAPALHAADVGISVDTAVDVARDAADFVLLRRDLDTLRAGIEEGRATFANTLKYVLTTESANFGNMLSMAAASVVLPFLPLLAPQVLLNNFLSDVPAMALARDRVDPEMIARPQRWDVSFIRRFMVIFGIVSSVFDGLTFVTLLTVLRTRPAGFQTGWFIESLATELLVALVVRTRRPFWRSRPGLLLSAATAAVGVLALALPYTVLGRSFGFVRLPLGTMAALLGITAAYVAVVEALKRALWARLESRAARLRKPPRVVGFARVKHH